MNLSRVISPRTVCATGVYPPPHPFSIHLPADSAPSLLSPPSSPLPQPCDILPRFHQTLARRLGQPAGDMSNSQGVSSDKTPWQLTFAAHLFLLMYEWKMATDRTTSSGSTCQAQGEEGGEGGIPWGRGTHGPLDSRSETNSLFGSHLRGLWDLWLKHRRPLAPLAQSERQGGAAGRRKPTGKEGGAHRPVAPVLRPSAAAFRTPAAFGRLPWL